MTLKEEFKKWSKDFAYDSYLSIVYDCKDYDDITRPKMVSEILETYNQEGFLLNICTERELDFLEYALKNRITERDKNKYTWEIINLHEKCIFSTYDYAVYEEQKENVAKALEYYRNGKYTIYDTIVLIISIVKVHGNIPLIALRDIVGSMSNIKEEHFDQLLGNPLLHFYCEFLYHYIPSYGEEVEIISYRKYYGFLDELDAARREYGESGAIEINLNDYRDIFYYGFPIKNEKVRKMFEEVKSFNPWLLTTIERVRVLNDRDHLLFFIIDEGLLKLVNEALDEIPCAAMNGCTPKMWLEKKKRRKAMEVKFTKIPQNNAHLSKKAADLYYKLFFALLEYTNDRYNVNPDIKKIYRQEGLDGNEIFPISEYLVSHREIIDEFIDDNIYDFTEKELEEIANFKSAIYSDEFLIVGFEREYTEILSTDGKIYMVKGVREDIDKLVLDDKLPLVIKTILLMFDGKIIFNSMFYANYYVDFGVEFEEHAFEEKEKAIRYYHL